VIKKLENFNLLLINGRLRLAGVGCEVSRFEEVGGVGEEFADSLFSSLISKKI